MKKYLILLFLVLAYCSTKSQVKEAVNAQFDPENVLTYAQSKLVFEQTKVFPNQTQVSIALIKNGAVSFYGIKRANDSILTSQNHDKVFEIGSITKVFTATLLAQFVLDKKLALDHSINDYLAFPLKDSVKLSFKQLANHTSGLPRLPSNLDLNVVDEANPYQTYGEKALIDYLTEELSLTQAPGEKSDYSNLGVGLLGYVLSQIEHTSYETLLKRYIFSKYQMASSSTLRKQVESRLIIGLNEKGEEVPNWDMSILMGAGGILSTTEDLSKFALAQFDSLNTELALTRKINFKANEVVELGLGWAIIKQESGAGWYWHNGGTGGYTSTIILDTKLKNGIIILSNVSAFSSKTANISDIAVKLMETF